MKRIAFIFVLCLVIILSGCKSQPSSPVSSGNAQSVGSQAEPPTSGVEKQYYTDGGDIYCYDTVAQESHLVISGTSPSITSFCVIDNYIYYCSPVDQLSKNGDIWEYDIKSGQSTKIATDNCTAMAGNGDYVFYSGFNDSELIINSYDIANKTTSIIFRWTTDNLELLINSLGIYRDKLIFSMGNIYQTDLNGNGFKELRNVNAYYNLTYFFINGDDLYYYDLNNENGGEICRLNLNTMECQSLVSGIETIPEVYPDQNKVFYTDDESLNYVDLDTLSHHRVMGNYPKNIKFFSNGKMFYYETGSLKSM